MLGYKILQGNLINYKDCTESLDNKIVNEINNYTSYSEFIEQLKSKDITHTRLSRVLCHILLDITRDMYYEENNCTYPYIPYIFILGMNSRGEELMSMIKTSCTLPYFTSYVDALDYDFGDAASNQSKTILDADINATRIANMIQAHKTGAKVISELSRKFLKI